MMHTKRLVSLLYLTLTFAPKLSIAQEQTDKDGYSLHATVSVNGPNISISASSPRPLLQATTALRRTQGWTIDYEDPEYGDSATKVDQESRRSLVGGKFTSTLQEQGVAEKIVIESLVQQFNQQSKFKYKAVQNTGTRVDIVPETPDSTALLDTPVRIDNSPRSIGAAVDAILQEVSRATGASIVRGGMIDNDLLNSKFTYGGNEVIPARQLLAQALDSAPIQKIWILTYEPEDKTYYIGIESAVKAHTSSTGDVLVNTIPSTPYK